MKAVLDFITQNQTLICIVLVIGSYFLNKIINMLAARPQEDIWDKIQPYSNALCSIVFDGVEFLSKNTKLTSVQKANEYAKVLSDFDENYRQDKQMAVSNLFAWYQSKKNKAEELTSDTVAQE